MQPMFLSNCLFWALFKLFTAGGIIGRVTSNHGPYARFVWSPDGNQWYRFCPCHPRTYAQLPWLLKKIPLHVILFRGYIKQTTSPVTLLKK